MLINNAGIFPLFERFENTSRADLEKCLNVDFYSVAYSIQVMYPHISRSDTPAFVTVASSAALAPLAGTSLYTAAKSASKALTECFACEHPEMYVGCVCPGFTKTNLFAGQKEEMTENKLISAFMSKREQNGEKNRARHTAPKAAHGLRRRCKGNGIFVSIVSEKFPSVFRWIMKISKQRLLKIFLRRSHDARRFSWMDFGRFCFTRLKACGRRLLRGRESFPVPFLSGKIAENFGRICRAVAAMRTGPASVF